MRRALLSVFVVFHLFAVLVSPNSDTYLGYRFASVVLPYVRVLELGAGWGFFAPDPGPPPAFIEWVAVKGDGSVLRGRWPDERDAFVLRDRLNRRITMGRFMATQPDRAAKMLGPSICRRDSAIAAVHFWRVTSSVPSLTDVRAGTRRIGDAVDIERVPLADGRCGNPR